ncbi:MAG: ABC transporter permease [Proteobacteria bacterium]|nr:ABC transporter permease [Pseudomonadota bacterium]
MLKSTLKAIQKIGRTAYSDSVAVMTIALSVFITATFGLFLTNARNVVDGWEKGGRIMAYIADGLSSEQMENLGKEIVGIQGVAGADFISKAKALEFLKDTLKGQSSLLADLKDNPLPNAFEIHLSASRIELTEIETIASKIKAMKKVTSVEYGQAWLKKFVNIFRLFQIATLGIAALFFMASVFILGNTIRLTLYTRWDEIEIMRLVGASDAFIKKPFYIQGIILSAFGGVLGLAASYAAFLAISSSVIQDETAQFISLHFFSSWICLVIVICSILIGWLGCSLSLSQFLKK